MSILWHTYSKEHLQLKRWRRFQMKWLIGLTLSVSITGMSVCYAGAGTGGFASTEPQEYIEKAQRKILVELYSGIPSSAEKLFVKIYSDPSTYTNGEYFNTPMSELNFQLRLMTKIWKSVSWNILPIERKIRFLKAALNQAYSLPQYRWDLIDRLKSLNTLEAYAVIFSAAHSEPNYVDVSETNIAIDYINANHRWLPAIFGSLGRNRNLNDSAPEAAELFGLVGEWIINKYSGSINKLVDSANSKSSTEAKNLVSFLIESNPAFKSRLTPASLSKLYMIIAPYDYQKNCTEALNSRLSNKGI